MIGASERISTSELDVEALRRFIMCFFDSCGGGLDFVKSIGIAPKLGLMSSLGGSIVTLGGAAAQSKPRGTLILATGAISVVKGAIRDRGTYGYN